MYTTCFAQIIGHTLAKTIITTIHAAITTATMIRAIAFNNLPHPHLGYAILARRNSINHKSRPWWKHHLFLVREVTVRFDVDAVQCNDLKHCPCISNTKKDWLFEHFFRFGAGGKLVPLHHIFYLGIFAFGRLQYILVVHFDATKELARHRRQLFKCSDKNFCDGEVMVNPPVSVAAIVPAQRCIHFAVKIGWHRIIVKCSNVVDSQRCAARLSHFPKVRVFCCVRRRYLSISVGDFSNVSRQDDHCF